MDNAYRWYVEGVAAFDCHERVAVDLGGLKSKIATLYSMDLITPGEYTALLRFADDSFEEVQAYIWEDLFQEEDA